MWGGDGRWQGDPRGVFGLGIQMGVGLSTEAETQGGAVLRPQTWGEAQGWLDFCIQNCWEGSSWRYHFGSCH